MLVELPGYRDLQLVGEGGLGRVYRAIRESTGGLVAIKELRDVASASPAWHRARRELEAMLRLKGHASVVSVEEVVVGPTGPCIVMEYVAGGSLIDRLASGPLSFAEIVLIGREVSEALAAAHEAGVVHRDIKPHNILVTAFGHVKVCDFGISALARDGDGRTQTNALTLAYASPEELDGSLTVGPPADVYSLSATLQHLYTGRKPTFSDRLAGGATFDRSVAGADPVARRLLTVLAGAQAHDAATRPTMHELLTEFERAGTALGGARLARLGAPVDPDATHARPPAPPAATIVRPPPPAASPAMQPPPPLGATPPALGAATSGRRRLPTIGIIGVALVAGAAVAGVGGFLLTRPSSGECEGAAVMAEPCTAADERTTSTRAPGSPTTSTVGVAAEATAGNAPTPLTATTSPPAATASTSTTPTTTTAPTSTSIVAPTTTTINTTTTTTSTAPPIDPAIAAVFELQSRAEADSASLDANVAGAYVVQVNAKFLDRVDELDGQYYDAAAILAVYEELDARYGGVAIIVADDYSTGSNPGLYQMLLEQPFASQAAGKEWCAQMGLGINECIARGTPLGRK